MVPGACVGARDATRSVVGGGVSRQAEGDSGVGVGGGARPTQTTTEQQPRQQGRVARKGARKATHCDQASTRRKTGGKGRGALGLRHPKHTAPQPRPTNPTQQPHTPTMLQAGRRKDGRDAGRDVATTVPSQPAAPPTVSTPELRRPAPPPFPHNRTPPNGTSSMPWCYRRLGGGEGGQAGPRRDGGH